MWQNIHGRGHKAVEYLGPIGLDEVKQDHKADEDAEHLKQRSVVTARGIGVVQETYQ